MQVLAEVKQTVLFAQTVQDQTQRSGACSKAVDLKKLYAVAGRSEADCTLCTGPDFTAASKQCR